MLQGKSPLGDATARVQNAFAAATAQPMEEDDPVVMVEKPAAPVRRVCHSAFHSLKIDSD
jgi:hypothetical protein